MGELFIGTTGYSYKEWRDIFYPKGVAQKNWLNFYAQHYNTVQINATFYQIFARSVFEKWYTSTPPGFRFALKAPQIITHEKMLLGVEEDLRSFVENSKGLEEKCAVMLWQFPPGTQAGQLFNRLEQFLPQLPTTVQHAFEFRHASWFNDKVYALLNQYHAGFVINDSTDPTHRWIVNTVSTFAQKAGIGMPDVAIYDGEPNAFATGAFKNSALVAVSTGLLQSMTREEVEAVIGHEVAHVANGDMVTMTLIQGVMNTFVVFISRIVGYFVDRVLLKNERDGVGPGFFITTLVMDILLGFVAAMIVAWFSRQREFRADAGSAQYLGSGGPMVNALKRLGGLAPGELPKAIQAFGITDKSGILALFSTHPPIEQRIAALQSGGR